MSLSQLETTPKDKKRMTIILLCIAITGSILIYLFSIYMNYINHLSHTSPDLAIQKLKISLYCVMVFWTIVLLTMSIYVLWISKKVYQTACFPPPGMKVLYDKKKIIGLKAKRLAIVFSVSALLLMICGISIPCLIVALLKSL